MTSGSAIRPPAPARTRSSQTDGRATMTTRAPWRTPVRPARASERTPSPVRPPTNATTRATATRGRGSARSLRRRTERSATTEMPARWLTHARAASVRGPARSPAWPPTSVTARAYAILLRAPARIRCWPTARLVAMGTRVRRSMRASVGHAWGRVRSCATLLTSVTSRGPAIPQRGCAQVHPSRMDRHAKMETTARWRTPVRQALASHLPRRSALLPPYAVLAWRGALRQLHRLSYRQLVAPWRFLPLGRPLTVHR
jgi:hypothetical protein